jgi:hypothetical protein
LAQSHPMFAVSNGCHIGGTSHQKPAKARLYSPLLTLLDEPDFTRLATGDLKSGSAPQPERGRCRGNAGSHPCLSS